MSTWKIEDDLLVAKECVMAAFRAISEESNREMLRGSAESPATRADLAAEKAMRRVLEERRGDDSILGEEFGGEMAAGRIWLLDPIDGTINFMRSLPGWSVVCALLKDGETKASVIANHEWDFSWCIPGEMHLSSYFQRREGQDIALSEAVVASYFDKRRSLSEDFLRGSQALINNCAALRSFGSGSFELLLLASGQIDAFVQYDMHPWDHLPGELFVLESGGQVMQKGPWFAAARNDRLLQEIIHILY